MFLLTLNKLALLFYGLFRSIKCNFLYEPHSLTYNVPNGHNRSQPFNDLRFYPIHPMSQCSPCSPLSQCLWECGREREGVLFTYEMRKTVRIGVRCAPTRLSSVLWYGVRRDARSLVPCFIVISFYSFEYLTM
jgi:hypothetical protein